MAIYHVTPTRNHISIRQTGIDPLLSRSPFKASWYVTSEKLAWAMAHCSVRYNIPVSALEVWFLPNGDLDGKTRSRWPGIFYTHRTIHPVAFLSAEEALEELK